MVRTEEKSVKVIEETHVTKSPVDATSSKKPSATPKRESTFSRLARPKPRSALSTDDLAVVDMKKFAFKASPLNRKILQRNCMSGIKVVKKRPITVPVPFKFATDDRMQLRSRPVKLGSPPNNSPNKPLKPKQLNN